MRNKKTNEQFIAEVFNLVGNEYIFLEEYKNAKTSLKVKHNKCETIYSVRPDNFLQGYRCPECRKQKIANKLSFSTEEFKEKVFKEVNNEYTVLGDYINNKTKILFKHNKCNHEFLMAPEMFIGKKKQRCPFCKKEKLSNYFSYTTNDFINKILKYEKDFILLTNYKNTFTKIKLKHKICNKEFWIRPNDFQQGQRCPYCSKKSKGEEKIIKWLENNNYEFETQYTFNDCKYKKCLPFDFKLTDSSGKIILIEYDGIQHFKKCWYDTDNDFKLRKKRDEIKNKYCSLHENIDLYRISYKEFNNINQILTNIIKNYE